MRQETRRRLAILFCVWLLFTFIGIFQIRSSLETVHLARELSYQIPFAVEPFTNQIHAALYNRQTAAWEGANPYQPYELLAVNHRPFRGMSIYLTQLWDRRGFSVTVRRPGGTPFEAEYGFGHCTCSTYTVWQLMQLYLVAPLACVLLAFFVVTRWPTSVLAWSLCALLLSLSQISLFPHAEAGFSSTSNTMAWQDWFRIPATAYRAFVQNIWPATLIIFAVNLVPGRSKARWQIHGIAIVFLCFALVQVILAVAWSENYQPFVALYAWLHRNGTNLISAGFGLVTLVSFRLSRGLGAISGFLTAAAVSCFYWPIKFTAGTWIVDKPPMIQLVDSFHPHIRFTPDVLNTFVSHEFVVATFAAIWALITLLFSFRALGKWLAISFALLLPGTLFWLSILHIGWSVFFWFGSSFFALQCLLLCTGLGLLGVCLFAERVDSGARGTRRNILS